MAQKEYYHTAEEYRQHGMTPFLQHTGEYFAGLRSTPVCRAPIFPGSNNVSYTFSNELLLDMMRNPDTPYLDKAYKSAVKFGLKGYSKGGQNGIFWQRRQDGGLISATNGLVERDMPQVLADLDIQREGLDALRKVKIVWHQPDGLRVVGVYNPLNQRAIFLGTASY